MLGILVGFVSTILVTFPLTLLRVLVITPFQTVTYFATLPATCLAASLYRGFTFLYELSQAFETVYVFLSFAVICGICSGLVMYGASRQLNTLVYVAPPDGTRLPPVHHRTRISNKPRRLAKIEPSWNEQAQSFIDEFVDVLQNKPAPNPLVQANTIFEEEDEASDF